MRTKTSNSLRIDFYDAEVYIQEKNYIKATDTSATEVYLYDGATMLAKFTLDSSKKVTIDMTDYIRTYGSKSTLTIRSNGTGSPSINVGYTVSGLINPKSVSIPDTNLDGFIIAPPRMMYAGKNSFEFLIDSANTHEIDIEDNRDVTHGHVYTLAFQDDFAIADRDADWKVEYHLRPKVCGHKYASVRWVSAFGSNKVCEWEMKTQKVNAGDKVSLIALDGYNTIKGRVDSFSLFLDRLSLYDLWYYSDIITSSKVEVSIDGVNFRQVDVVTNQVTIPEGDAGEFNSLEIQINYRQYDAVTL